METSLRHPGMTPMEETSRVGGAEILTGLSLASITFEVVEHGILAGDERRAVRTARS
jgi:hypothetical protein